MSRPRDPYGLSRVIRPAGVLPQAAEQLDPGLPIGPDELLIDVEHLNVDAASFRQLAGEVGRDPTKLAARITEIVRERGKLQNPVTGSGGMLIGTVREVGPGHPGAATLKPGARIATLVSLTLTPLSLQEIVKVDLTTDRVTVRGHAILFSSGVYAELPDDLPPGLVLAALDVAGAAALAKRLVKAGQTVLVLGAGKSGALVAAQAKENGARVIALDVSLAAVEQLQGLGLADSVIAADATRAVEVMARVSEATGGALCDVVVNCASVPGTEMASILATRDRGAVVFFSMATSFTAAALGAEGAGKDVDLYVGNGYARGHAELTLSLLRRNDVLRRHFEERYAR